MSRQEAVPFGTIDQLETKMLETQIQPRTDEWKLDDEFIDSIAEANGNREPIHVWKNGDRYIIISGHRRAEACRKLGLRVNAIVWENMSLEEAKIWAIASNTARKKMSVPDIIMAIKKIRGNHPEIDSKTLQRQLGLPKSTFFRYDRISRLPPTYIYNVGNGLTQEQADLLSRFRPEDLEWASDYDYRRHLWMTVSIYQKISPNGPIIKKFRNGEMTQENIEYIYKKTLKSKKIVCEDHLWTCEHENKCGCECEECSPTKEETSIRIEQMADKKIKELTETWPHFKVHGIDPLEFSSQEEALRALEDEHRKHVNSFFPLQKTNGLWNAAEFCRRRNEHPERVCQVCGDVVLDNSSHPNKKKLYVDYGLRWCDSTTKWHMSLVAKFLQKNKKEQESNVQKPVPSGTEICECVGCGRDDICDPCSDMMPELCKNKEIVCELHGSSPKFGICSCSNEAEMKCPKCDYAVCPSSGCRLYLSSHVKSEYHWQKIEVMYVDEYGNSIDTQGRKWRQVE